jgi:hypothetical protein
MAVMPYEASRVSVHSAWPKHASRSRRNPALLSTLTEPLATVVQPLVAFAPKKALKKDITARPSGHVTCVGCA